MPEKSGLDAELQVIVKHGDSLSVNDLPAEILDATRLEQRRVGVENDKLTDVELEAMRTALAACNGNVSAAARRLGVSRSTLYRRKL